MLFAMLHGIVKYTVLLSLLQIQVLMLWFTL